jgi:hypothetical protein
MSRQTNIFEFATQKDRLELAYQILSEVYEEGIMWDAVQTAVNCQVQANRVVWKVNDTYFDTPEWNPDEQDDLPLMKWIPCKERLPEQAGWCIVTEWSTEELRWDVTMDEWRFRDGQGKWHFASMEQVLAWMPMPEIYEEVNT